MRPVTVMLEDDTREALEIAAREEDRTISNLIRKIVLDYLRKRNLAA